MKKMFFYLCAMAAFQAPILGQSNQDSIASGDQQMVATIATYPKDLRNAVLDVAQYSQVLIKLERIQAQSSQSFKDMISGYSRSDQENFYEASRYPDILNQLVKNGKLTDDQAKTYIGNLPADSQTKILNAYHGHFDELQKMDAMYQSSQDALQQAINDYPANVQADFKTVVAHPDAMNLLAENIDMTVSLGQEYRSNPDEVTNEMDSINDQATQQNARDLANYKKEVENNPQMQQEMKQAADSFSSTYGGDQVYNDPNQAPPTVNNYYNYNPYPYWFSYPYWYNSPMWYPVPYYYNTGFYYGAGGGLVVWGLPSPYYMGWFYHTGYRNYPYLYRRSNVYFQMHQRYIARINVYHGPRNFYSGRNNYRGEGARTTRYYNAINRSGPARSNTSVSRSSTPVNRSHWAPNHVSRTQAMQQNRQQSFQQRSSSQTTNRSFSPRPSNNGNSNRSFSAPRSGNVSMGRGSSGFAGHAGGGSHGGGGGGFRSGGGGGGGHGRH